MSSPEVCGPARGLTNQANRRRADGAPARRRRGVRVEREVRPHVFYATSRSTRGFLAATMRRVRAAPDGARRPCSHSWSVRTDTPSSDANFAWESPVRSRMVATGGTVITRPTSPRFNWRSPSRISVPTFRFATALAIDFILDLFKNMSRDVLRYILRVKSQHPDLPGAQLGLDEAEHAPLYGIAVVRQCRIVRVRPIS